jgi:DNA polymerase
MSYELKEGIKTILEFYKELGFERLPFNYSEKFQVTSNESESKEEKTDNSLLNKEATLNALSEEIGDCQRCKLSKERTHIVFGEGNAYARIMFIGEAPGREEDLQARPFVGEAGQLLTRLIEKMGFKREDVYIANIVKCRPPMNRDPQEDEISICLPFLERQVEIISPEIIIALGKISAYTLLNIKSPISKFSISKIRGKFYEYKGIPVMPTFHPAYLLRNPKDKWLVWADAQAALKKISQHEF